MTCFLINESGRAPYGNLLVVSPKFLGCFMEKRGTGGVIYLPYLALLLTAWSPQKGMWTLNLSNGGTTSHWLVNSGGNVTF